MKKNYIAPDTILKKVNAVSILAGSPGVSVNRTEGVYATGDDGLARESDYERPSGGSIWDD